VEAGNRLKQELQKAVKEESRLLSAFRKYLPFERGYVLQKSVELLSKLSDSITESDLRTFYPEIDNLLSIQKVCLLRYVAFLVSILRYEKELKEAEYWEGDYRLAQLRDERLRNIALALKKESKRGRRPKKRSKLEALRGELLALRKEGLGGDILVKYLWKAHRLKVSKQYLLRVLKEWEEQEKVEQAEQRT
jgi:hypothetical protein